MTADSRGTAAPAPPATDGPGDGADTGTATSPGGRALWRYARGPLAALAVLTLTAVLLALLSSSDTGNLDPTAASPDGSRAVAELLDDEGVTTTLTTTVEEATDRAGPDTTVLVAHPDAVSPSHLARLQDAVIAEGGRLVLVAPTDSSLAEVAPGTTTAASIPAEETDPDCRTPATQRVGSATLGGHLYQLPEHDDVAGVDSVTTCYTSGELPSLVVLDHDPGETVLLGSPHILLNEHLADHGNAALALRLLGGHPDVTWYLPDVGEAPAAEDEQAPLDLLPDGWRWAALQLGVAVALTAVWRMRRLGPLVTERLPVHIRAAETTEGRARLYHHAAARDRAADALRDATRGRLASFTGVATTAGDGAALTTAAAARSGQPPQEVHDLLYGVAPNDDRALLRLADQLDALERRVGPTGPVHGAGATPGTGGRPAATDPTGSSGTDPAGSGGAAGGSPAPTDDDPPTEDTRS